MMSQPKTEAVDPTVGNLNARKIATNEQAQPLAYFAGRPPWLPLVWAQSNIYKVRAQAVTQKVGKSKQTTGYDYFGSLVGVLGCCRLDYLEQIEVAGKVVWGGAIHRDEDHPHHSGDIVVDGVGTFRVYWGTDDQPYDDLVLTGTGGSFALADGGCGEEHPRYLDLPYLVVKDCYFGNNNSTPPTIRVMAERAAYFEGLDEQRSREGANPVTVLAELIGNPFFGLGLPDAIHVASAAALAADVRRNTPVPIDGDPEYIAAMGYISPLLDKQDSLEGIISRLLVHYDGWLRPIDGQIYFGRFPRDGVIPEDLPELSYHDFISGQRPRFSATGDGELVTEAVIVHVDRDDSMEKAATPVPNPAARRRLGYANPQTYNRPWVITTYQAFEQGNQLARHYSREEEGCDVSVSRQRVVGLRAGDRFVLVDAPSESSQVVRITQRVDSASGEEVQLQLVLERGLSPVAYVPPPNPRPILPDPELVAVVNARAFQLPTLFADYGPAPAVVLLAERPGAHVAGYKAYFSNAGLTFDRMTEDGRWALRATLASTVNAAATTFTINSGGFDIAHLAGQSDTQRDDDTLLLFIGFELCSIGAVTPIGGGQYTVAVLRGRRGSFAASHTATAEVWIMPRMELQVLQHADFPRTIASRFFRLASYTTTRGGEEQSIEDALEIELEFDDTEVVAPDDLAAVGKAEAIFISWAYPEPPDDSTIIATDLWIRATNTTPDPAMEAPDHTLRATGFNLGGLTAGTTRYIWAQNRDTIGGRSALEGPVAATANAAATGPTGNSRERRYIRSALVPSTPTGNNPVGWTLDIPSGTDAVWASDATKDGSGNLVGSWSTPQRLSGSVIFYTSGPPSGTTLIDGDTYFDTADNFKIYRRTGGSWVASFQPLIKLDGSNNITGLVKADGTDKDFVLVANKFQVWNGTSADVPFEIVGGATYIKDAFIQNVAAGKINAGTVNVALTLGVLGSITAGSGFGQFSVNNSELKHGVMTVRQYPSLNGTEVAISASGHSASLFAHSSVSGLLLSDSFTGKQVTIQDNGLLRTNGALEVKSAGSATFECSIAAQSHVNLANGCNLNCGGDIYLGLSGANRWLYDGNGNRILQQRYGSGNPGDASDLATAISLVNWCKDVFLHHGLGF